MTADTPPPCLYDAAALDVVLARMVRELDARLPPAAPVTLVGLLRRGLPLAERLQAGLRTLSSARDVRVYPLAVKRYADDLQLLHADTALEANPAIAALDLAGTRVVLVDDVLYGGYTLLRAAAWLAQAGATDVLTTVLVDRAVARVPVRADITGLHLQVAPGDIVECHVPPYEPDFAIRLVRPALR